MLLCNGTASVLHANKVVALCAADMTPVSESEPGSSAAAADADVSYGRQDTRPHTVVSTYANNRRDRTTLLPASEREQRVEGQGCQAGVQDSAPLAQLGDCISCSDCVSVVAP